MVAGRKNEAEGLGRFEVTRSRVVLDTKTCRSEFLAKCLCHTPRALASYWFHDPEVLDITGQIPMRAFLKFHIYIPNLRNKYSIYFCLSLISF